jgi:uncharacterized membrane protein YccC
MHWLYLLAAVICFALALIKTLPPLVVLLCLAGALGFVFAWLLGVVSARISSQSRDVTVIMSSDELRRLREQAEARRNAEAGNPEGEPRSE